MTKYVSKAQTIQSGVLQFIFKEKNKVQKTGQKSQKELEKVFKKCVFLSEPQKIYYTLFIKLYYFILFFLYYSDSPTHFRNCLYFWYS